MADSTPAASDRPEDMHWGISYLREDIQDLRQDVRALHERIDRSDTRREEMGESLAQRIDRSDARREEMGQALTKRIDSRFAVLLTAMVGLTGVAIAANVAFLQLYLG